MSLFSDTLTSAGFKNVGWVTDTSRNGVTNERQDCANWCNINNSGLGRRPEPTPSGLGFDVDALVWAKTPGESDGTPRHRVLTPSATPWTRTSRRRRPAPGATRSFLCFVRTRTRPSPQPRLFG